MVVIMHLTDIVKPDVYYDTVSIYNKSPEYFALVINLTRKKLGIRKEDTLLIQNLNEFLSLEETLSNPPLFSTHWLVYIEDTKRIMSKEEMELLMRLQRVIIIVGTSNYGTFLKLKSDKRWGQRYTEFMYASSLTKEEFDFLYDLTISVKQASSLNEDLLLFVKSNYLRELDSIFKLLSALKVGIVFTNKAELISHIGVGGLSVEFETLGILGTTASTERGIRMFLKKRSNNLIELMIRNKPNTLKMNIIASCKAILIVKQLLLGGSLISGFSSKVETSVYNNNRVSKYLKQLDRIENISLTRIILLLAILQEEPYWTSELDIMHFLNKYVIQLNEERRLNETNSN